MKKLAYVVVCLMFISCKNSEKNDSKIITLQSADTINNNDRNESAVFKIMNRGYSGFEHEGILISKKFWKDKNGRNTVLFAKNKFDIYAYHYLIPTGDVKLLQRIEDGINGCDADLTLDLIYESISITDLNNDDIGEITFAYTKACISDVSPLNLSLYTLTGGNQYHITGQTAVFLDDKKIGGSTITNSTFDKASESLKVHAEKIWSDLSEK